MASDPRPRRRAHRQPPGRVMPREVPEVATEGEVVGKAEVARAETAARAPAGQGQAERRTIGQGRAVQPGIGKDKGGGSAIEPDESELPDEIRRMIEAAYT